MKSEDGELLLGRTGDCLAFTLAWGFQALEPGVFQGHLEGDAFLGVVAQELFDQVAGGLGNDDLVPELVAALDGVLQYLGDGVVVEGEGTSEPGWGGGYMK